MMFRIFNTSLRFSPILLELTALNQRTQLHEFRILRVVVANNHVFCVTRSEEKTFGPDFLRITVIS